MGQAIGQVLFFAVGVALSPLSIIPVVLILGTERGRTNGPAFILGWVLGLAVAGTLVLVLASGGSAADEQGAPAEWVNVLKLVLGALLLALALRQWRGRPRAGETAKMPGWMSTVDGLTARRSFSLGVGLSAINPKCLLLVVGAATAIAQTDASAGSQAVALIVFIAIATIGPGTPVVLFFVMGERSKELLEELKDWMSQHNAAIMTVLCLVIGAKLIGDAISGFAG